MKLKKYLLLSLISTVVLSGCSMQENTNVTENTEESSIVGELVAGVAEQVLKDAINNILTPTPTPTPTPEPPVITPTPVPPAVTPSQEDVGSQDSLAPAA